MGVVVLHGVAIGFLVRRNQRHQFPISQVSLDRSVVILVQREGLYKVPLCLFDFRVGLLFVLLQGHTVSNGENDQTVVLDEASVEVGESKDVLDLFQRLDGLDLL